MRTWFIPSAFLESLARSRKELMRSIISGLVLVMTVEFGAYNELSQDGMGSGTRVFDLLRVPPKVRLYVSVVHPSTEVCCQ